MKEFVRTTQTGNLCLFRFVFVSCVRAGEAKLCERVRAMDFSTLGSRLGRFTTAAPARGCSFGEKLVLYSWALRHLA